MTTWYVKHALDEALQNLSSTGWGYCRKVLPMLADVQKLVG